MSAGMGLSPNGGWAFPGGSLSEGAPLFLGEGLCPQGDRNPRDRRWTWALRRSRKHEGPEPGDGRLGEASPWEGAADRAVGSGKAV